MSPGDPSKDESSLSEYIQRICAEIALPFTELARLLKQDPVRLSRELRHLDRVRATTLSELAECLDSTTEDLLNRTIPVETIAQRRLGFDPMPERYVEGAASKIGNLLPIFTYLDESWSEKISRNILRELKLSTRLLERPQTPVSLRLIGDVMDKLKPRGFGEEEFFEMGLQVPRTPHYRKMADALKRLPTVSRMYEKTILEITGVYEQNFTYQLLRLTPGSMTMRIRPNAEIQDAFGAYKIDTPAVAAYRAGIIASHPGFLGRASARIAKRRCMHEGARDYVYELTW